MKLFRLLKGIKCRVLGSQLVDVEGLCFNDKQAQKNHLYFCIRGIKDDGADYVLSAVARGVVAVVSEKEFVGLKGVVQILVKDVRKTMSLIAKNFYENPAMKLKLVGVTGTNGKTTTTYMISGLLNDLGVKSAIIGTNGVVFEGKVVETGMTTPDPIELYKILRRLADLGVQVVCMEVSAHAIYLRKIDGLIFDIVIFSNLTEDHLDYFETMERYFDAKKKLFSKRYAEKALINIDDVYGKRLFESINLNKKSYSICREADYISKNLGIENFVQKMVFQNKILFIKFLGEFNIYNLLSAISCVMELGFSFKNIQNTLDKLEFVPGRFNLMVIKQKLFIIDYAHTPDGLENVLKLCKGLLTGGKLINVFGCGGDRETQKRPKMGEISSKYANFTIITSDNPRFESREKIANEIAQGVCGDSFKIILDRIEAIVFADSITKEGDVILIAGKGCEDYIDELGVKKRYSDFEQVQKLRK